MNTTRRAERSTANAVSMRSSKEEIITAAVEIIDLRTGELHQLQQRQRVLWALVALLSATLLVIG